MDILKPCPFCGSPVQLVQLELAEGFKWCVQLNCKYGCILDGTERFEVTGTREQALNSWNQRNGK